MSGCGGGGHPGGGYPGHGGGGYNTNVNVNVNANASASAYSGSYAGAGAVINARGYDVGAIRGGGGYGGAIVSGSGYGGWDSLGYGGNAGAVVVRGPGYGPSRPFGYSVRGFGRRYVTTDRCGSCGAPPPPPPPSCHDRCGGEYDGGHDRGNRYSERDDHSDRGQYGPSDCGCEGPRYVAQPYYAAPLEPVGYGDHGYQGGYESQSYQSQGYAQQGYSAQTYERYESQSSDGGYEAQAYGGGGYEAAPYAPPQVTYAPQPYAPQSYAPAEYAPQVIEQAPVYIQAPADYYGDLPPGDDGVSIPYRQEPGERG